MPHHFHRDQQQDAHAVQRIGEIHPVADVHKRGGGQQDKADRHVKHLFARPRRDVAAGNRIEHRNANAGDHHDYQQQRPMKFLEFVGE